MKERAADVLDISRRIQVQLCGGEANDFSAYDGVILAADDLAPSETLQLDTDKILGFVTSGGSTNSHTAILARTLGITAVVNTGTQLHTDVEGKTVIVDGFTGTVYLDPDSATLDKMKKKQAEAEERKIRLEAYRGKESVTFSRISEILIMYLKPWLMMRKGSAFSVANSYIWKMLPIRRKSSSLKLIKRRSK